MQRSCPEILNFCNKKQRWRESHTLFFCFARLLHGGALGISYKKYRENYARENAQENPAEWGNSGKQSILLRNTGERKVSFSAVILV